MIKLDPIIAVKNVVASSEWYQNIFSFKSNHGGDNFSVLVSEDNDIILSLVKSGFEIAYVPQLVVHHLIPANRYSKEYLERMAFESNRTWVKVLAIHGINPHKKIRKWTVLPRKIRSYVIHRAWQKKPLQAIRWRSSCGTFTGLSEI